MAGEGIRLALKGKTPSAHARLKYITREGKYAKGIDGKRDDLVASGSGNLPNWADDADQFWQGVDQFERANARRCVELELNLPPELTLDQQKQVVAAYAERLLGAERLPHTWAIHGRDKNPHVHLMFQERGLDGIERPDAKAWFKRADSAHPERGGALKSRSIHGAAWTMQARATWAETANDGLRAAGHAARFNHRSKAVQRDDALRNGDLRRAAELGTLTERHEGAKINGMRRRVERGEIEFERLPEYARQRIQQNERVRAYNNELRDWARTAPEAELAERLAPDLRAVENPGAHVAAYLEKAHTEALVMDAVFEAHTEALALNKVFDAHSSAAKLASALARIDTLKTPLPRPPEVAVAEGLRTAYDTAKDNLALAKEAERKAKEAAESWHKAHKIKSVLGLSRPVDAAAEAAKKARIDLEKAVEKSRNAYRDAPERQVAMAWEQSNKAAVAELESLQAQLPALQKVADEAQANAYPYEVLAVIEEQAEQLEQLNSAKIASDLLRQAKAAADAGDGRILVRLRGLGHEALERAEVQLIERGKALIDDARRDLRRASGLIENHLTWCPYDEREPLLALRRELERELDLLRQTLPAPAEALQLRESAAQRLGQVEGWRESQDAAKAERLRDRQQRPDADPAPEHDPSPSRQGPRLG